MRVLRIFFTATAALLVIAVLTGLIAREILLGMAVRQLRAAAKELRTLQSEPEFVQSCLEFSGTPPEGQSLIRAQLRFLSDREYALELVCQTSESLRSVIRTDMLPALVKKDPGQSGLIQGQPFHGMTVSLFGRTGVVYEDEAFVRSALQYSEAQSLVFDEGPQTICQGYGFQCCSEVSQSGLGDQQSGATDCPRSCYAACAEKPLVLHFTSDPPPLSGTRVVSADSGQPIEFFYTVNDIRADTSPSRAAADSGTVSVVNQFLAFLQGRETALVPRDELEKTVIVFGDGQSAELSDLQGSVEHTYTCLQALCVYNVTVQANTRNGIASTLSDDNRLEIQVRRQ